MQWGRDRYYSGLVMHNILCLMLYRFYKSMKLRRAVIVFKDLEVVGQIVCVAVSPGTE